MLQSVLMRLRESSESFKESTFPISRTQMMTIVMIRVMIVSLRSSHKDR
jgi:hypothetical protein